MFIRMLIKLVFYLIRKHGCSKLQVKKKHHTNLRTIIILATIEWLSVSIILANVRYYRVADSEYDTS